MSDPVTNVDVEDVLSSIRRLVSDTGTDLRPAPKRPADDTTTTPRQPDALLLTSALRVKDKDGGKTSSANMTNLRSTLGHPAAGDQPSGDADKIGPQLPLDRERRLHLENVDASQTTGENLGSPKSTTTDEYYEDEELTSPPPVIDFVRRDRRAVEDKPVEQAADDTSADATAEAETQHSASSITQDDGADAQTDADFEDFTWPEMAATPDHVLKEKGDASDADHGKDTDASATVDTVQEAELSDNTANEPETGAHTDDDPEADIDESADSDVGAGTDDETAVYDADPVAASAAVIVEDVDADVEPDVKLDQSPEEDADDFSEETVFAAASAASVMDDDEAPDSQYDDRSKLGDFDDTLIDEDALRDLVAEIVRQELTGALGERITRNVRKLVRREIHRALLTREFE